MANNKMTCCHPSFYAARPWGSTGFTSSDGFDLLGFFFFFFFLRPEKVRPATCDGPPVLTWWAPDSGPSRLGRPLAKWTTRSFLFSFIDQLLLEMFRFAFVIDRFLMQHSSKGGLSWWIRQLFSFSNKILLVLAVLTLQRRKNKRIVSFQFRHGNIRLALSRSLPVPSLTANRFVDRFVANKNQTKMRRLTGLRRSGPPPHLLVLFPSIPSLPFPFIFFSLLIRWRSRTGLARVFCFCSSSFFVSFLYARAESEFAFVVRRASHKKKERRRRTWRTRRLVN